MNEHSFNDEALKLCVVVQEKGIMHTDSLAQLRRLMNVFEGIPAEGNKKAREREQERSTSQPWNPFSQS